MTEQKNLKVLRVVCPLAYIFETGSASGLKLLKKEGPDGPYKPAKYDCTGSNSLCFIEEKLFHLNCIRDMLDSLGGALCTLMA